MPLTATVRSTTDSLTQHVLVDDRHWLVTDEPERIGGNDTAPAPHELLPAALAACIVTVVRMYARRKGWELDEVGADVELDNDVTPRRCRVALHLPDDLTGEQRRRLEQVADSCPVHRTLEHGVVFETATVAAA